MKAGIRKLPAEITELKYLVSKMKEKKEREAQAMPQWQGVCLA